MDSASIIGVVGSIASIGGAVYAFYQASESKKYATKAEQVKSQMLGHKDLRELTEIHLECRRVEQAMIKYSAGSTPHSLVGVTPEVESAEVQKLIVLIQGNRSRLEEFESGVADEFCAKTTVALNKFSKSTLPNELREHGSNLLILINRLTGIVKELIDVKYSTTV